MRRGARQREERGDHAARGDDRAAGACDVTGDRRQSQVAAVLQAYGDRVQRSVFVCTAEPDLITEIRARIAGIIKPGTDSVYVFRQCAACWDAVGIHG